MPFTLSADHKLLAKKNLLKESEQRMRNPESSPVRRIERNINKQKRGKSKKIYFRNIDGSNNNIGKPEMNETDTALTRLTKSDYSDGISAMAGTDRPNPRSISNQVVDQNGSSYTYKLASDFLWQWGQFLDHDIDLTDGADPAEKNPIPIPAGDPIFDPDNTGTAVMRFNRSIYDEESGTDSTKPRQQLNEITGWIDASNVYGSDLERANALRTLDGTGQLKTSAKRLLPFNTEGLSNAGGPSEELFLAGDVRANEQVGLTAMHTLFVREHNRLARKLKKEYRHLNGDVIYEHARRIVAAQMQVITYKEFLPVLLGSNALAPYKGYKPEVDASISNEFSTAAYRLGHSLLSPQILRLNKKGKEIRHGHLSLRNAFFAPHRLVEEGNIAPILRGLAKQPCQDLDIFVIDDVRNFLFRVSGDNGFDLASLNIQRGRDHGLPGYNETRKLLGLTPVSGFADISSDEIIQTKLDQAYNHVDYIDLWVGGLAEDKYKDALVGKLFFTILKDQFERLRDGDRFWYENYFYGKELRIIEKTTLAKIIRRNTAVGKEIQDNVFLIRSKKQRKQQE